MNHHDETGRINRERHTRIILSCLLPQDPDVAALAEALNIEIAQAFGHLVSLWLYWAEWEPTGHLTKHLNPALVAHAAQWRGRSQRFFGALLDTGWLSPDGHLARWDELWPVSANGRDEWNRLRSYLRPLVLERDGAICRRCGAVGTEDAPLHIDHIRPLSKGGSNDPANLQVLCKSCNSSKGAKVDA